MQFASIVIGCAGMRYQDNFLVSARRCRVARSCIPGHNEVAVEICIINVEEAICFKLRVKDNAQQAIFTIRGPDDSGWSIHIKEWDGRGGGSWQNHFYRACPFSNENPVCTVACVRQLHCIIEA